ncbi:DUF885 family protein [Sphingomonas beigongshangi]|uniref:DUF885 family protein n=1 Tax=Sphingomonas beigongshangi TaxID=2782540 RepID=UPI001AEED0BB|nr:DUF885 family protein [Sphingomonas beigongshangi]
MTPSRRGVLTGIGAAAVTPAGATTRGGNTEIGLALDAAMALPVDDALSRLAPFRLDDAGPGRRLDLQAARAGLAIDRALTAARGEAASFSLRLQRIVGNDATLDRVARDLDDAHRASTAAADRLFQRLGIAGRSSGARFEALWRNPRWLFADDDAGRASAVTAMRATLAAIRPRLPHVLGPLPPECLAVDVRALDAAEIAAGKGGYRVLPSAGSQGLYVVDLKEVRRRPLFTLPSVVAHELLPGHMTQMPLEALARPHPLRLRYAAAFSEGWGIYAERLMATDGLYTCPEDMLGHLHWMLFRIARGLADIAIHVRGIAPDQAEAAMRETLGEPAYFAPFAGDVARIVAEPATRAGEAWLPLRLDRTRPTSRAGWPAWHAGLLRHGRLRTDMIRSR